MTVMTAARTSWLKDLVHHTRILISTTATQVVMNISGNALQGRSSQPKPRERGAPPLIGLYRRSFSGTRCLQRSSNPRTVGL